MDKRLEFAIILVYTGTHSTSRTLLIKVMIDLLVVQDIVYSKAGFLFQ